MSTLEEIETHKEEILYIASRHGVSRVRVFGSVARGDENSESDIDFLVATGDEVSPWFPAGLARELSALLDRRVEVVTEDGLNPLIRSRVLADAIEL